MGVHFYRDMTTLSMCCIIHNLLVRFKATLLFAIFIVFRGLCPKLPEAVMVFVCVLVCILLSSYLSSGMHTPDGNPCEDPE